MAELTAAQAIFQGHDANRVLWDALVDVLIEGNAIEPARLGVRIAEICDAIPTQNKGELFAQITQAAMKATVLKEYARLDEAPAWVQKMCQGESLGAILQQERAA